MTPPPKSFTYRQKLAGIILTTSKEDFQSKKN
jgi:hypothetical protein